MYVQACLEEAGDDADFITKALSEEGNASFASIQVSQALASPTRSSLTETTSYAGSPGKA